MQRAILLGAGLAACAPGSLPRESPAATPGSSVATASYEEVAARADACDGAARQASVARGCVTVVVEDRLSGWWRPKRFRLSFDGAVVYEREAREAGERFTVVIGPEPTGERVVLLETALDPPGTGVFAEERYGLRLERPVLVDVAVGAPIVVARLAERADAAYEERIELEAYLLPRE